MGQHKYYEARRGVPSIVTAKADTTLESSIEAARPRTTHTSALLQDAAAAAAHRRTDTARERIAMTGYHGIVFLPSLRASPLSSPPCPPLSLALLSRRSSSRCLFTSYRQPPHLSPAHCIAQQRHSTLGEITSQGVRPGVAKPIARQAQHSKRHMARQKVK
eukprot:3941585-Rhodomonas_salina.2